MGFILFVGIGVYCVLYIQNKSEISGSKEAIKSLFFLLIALGALALCATGYGTVFGVPLLAAIGRSCAKKI